MALNAFTLLEGVPVFDGKAEELQMFVEHIEEIRKYVDASQISLFDLRVKNKIVGRASITLINNNSPKKWDEIKVILRINFNISESLESIINKIKTAEYRNNISDFFDYMVKLLTKLNLKTSIDRENEQWYSCKNNEKMVLKIFISKLPNEPKLILNSRNPYSLLKAKEILIESDYFYKANAKSFSYNFSNNNNDTRKNFTKHNQTFTNSQYPHSFHSDFRQIHSNFHQFNPNSNNFVHGRPNSGNNNSYNLNNNNRPQYNLLNFRNNQAYNPNFQNRHDNSLNFRNNNSSNSGNFSNSMDTSSQSRQFSVNNSNNSNKMEVDSNQVSNFQLLAEDLYPV